MLLIGAGLTLGVLPTADAAAATGTITRAQANADWTQGSVAGSVTWTGCVNAVTPPAESLPGPEEPLPEPESSRASTSSTPESPYCAWTPYLTVAPASSSPDCSAAVRQLPDLGEGVSLVWSGGERIETETVSFDVPNTPLDGKPEQLLCLSLTEVAQSGETIPCAPPGEPVPPGWHCPYKNNSYPYVLASTQLSAASGTGVEWGPGPGNLLPRLSVEILSRQAFVTRHGWTRPIMSCAGPVGSVCRGDMALTGIARRPGGGKVKVYARRKFALAAGTRRAVALHLRGSAALLGQTSQRLRVSASVRGGNRTGKTIALRWKHRTPSSRVLGGHHSSRAHR
jgi:hypothetical protein